jgi:hypothetical protein
MHASHKIRGSRAENLPPFSRNLYQKSGEMHLLTEKDPYARLDATPPTRPEDARKYRTIIEWRSDKVYKVEMRDPEE